MHVCFDVYNYVFIVTVHVLAIAMLIVQEMIYSITVMVVGKLLFGFILGSIASTLANLDSQRVIFEEKLNALKVKHSVAVFN